MLSFEFTNTYGDVGRVKNLRIFHPWTNHPAMIDEWALSIRQYMNKRSLGSYIVGCLPENDCYKGIGKHSSTQSPAMNFDRSAVSLRLYMEKFLLIFLKKLTGCRTSSFLNTSLCKTCEPQGNDLNKLGWSSLSDTTTSNVKVTWRIPPKELV